jgi:Lamin Tail Domain
MRLRHAALALAVTLVSVTAASIPAAATTPIVHFSKAYVNSPGTDNRTNSSLNAEYVVLKNSSSTTTYTLTGYTIRDTSAHVFKFPTFKLKPGASVTVHTGSGINTSSNLYWGSKAYVWTNTGDTATLKNTVGTTKDTCSWHTVSSYVLC